MWQKAKDEVFVSLTEKLPSGDPCIPLDARLGMFLWDHKGKITASTVGLLMALLGNNTLIVGIGVGLSSFTVIVGMATLLEHLQEDPNKTKELADRIFQRATRRTPYLMAPECYPSSKSGDANMGAAAAQPLPPTPPKEA